LCAAPVRQHQRTARRLLSRRVDVRAAQRDQAEVLGRIRIGDGRVHQRRHPGTRGAAPARAQLMAIRYAAPGRINLIGEHTDYNLGFALPIALPERTVVTFAPSDADALTVRSDGEDGVARIPLGTSPGGVTGWAAYVAGVVWGLRRAGRRLAGGEMSI